MDDEDGPMNCCQTCPHEMSRSDSASGGVQHESHPVTLKTMFLMLKPECFDRVDGGQYRFCASPHCSVVYFSDDRWFTTSDLRIRVGLKEKEDPIPLCYCFGFSEENARQELTVKGRTTILDRIKSLIKKGLCACEERNPSGTCCLGDATHALGRLMEENNEGKLSDR